MKELMVVQAFACCFMTGAIWLVQVLLYPNFRFVGAPEFSKFHEFHMNRITWVVAPVMGLELASGIGLLAMNFTAPYAYNLASIGALWIITAFINVPTHNQLRHEVASTKRNLVLGNWPRTLIWTCRSLFWIWILREKIV